MQFRTEKNRLQTGQATPSSVKIIQSLHLAADTLVNAGYKLFIVIQRYLLTKRQCKETLSMVFTPLATDHMILLTYL